MVISRGSEGVHPFGYVEHSIAMAQRLVIDVVIGYKRMSISFQDMERVVFLPRKCSSYVQ